MNKTICKSLIGLIALLFIGCKSYVQVFDTKGTNVKVENEFYVFENDTLKITYSFWSEKGLMTFAIFNKSNKPIYIDWKKSSYIDNSVKLNYWIDEEKIKTSEYYGSYFYKGPLLKPGYAISMTSGASVSSTVKIERITFIPPASNYYRSQFYILPINAFKFKAKVPSKEVPKNDNPKKKTKIYEKLFSKENSPLIFRNFLTFSFNESFENEFYVDNEFYIYDIKEMDKKQFEHLEIDRTKKGGRFFVKDENGLPVKISAYKKPSSFYIRLSSNVNLNQKK